MTVASILKAVAKYGAATVGFVVFGAMLLGDVRADQKKNTQLLMELKSQLVTHEHDSIRAMDLQGQTLRVMERLLLVTQQLCVQTADTSQQRRHCIQ